jgi:ribose transport system substrate-binding protein
MRSPVRQARIGMAAIALALAATGCGSTSTAGTSSGSGGAGTAGGSSTSVADGSNDAAATSSTSGASGSGQASVSAEALAQIEKNLEPYTGHPNAFPVTEKLTKRPPKGSTFAFLQCSTPICALIGLMNQQAAGALGVPLSVTKSAASAQALQDAMSSIIATKPSAVLIPAADPVQYKEPMSQLKQLGIPVVSQGVVDTAQFPAIKGSILGVPAATIAGTLLADWVVKRNGVSPSVFYTVPELSFSPFIVAGFKKEMASVCPTCQTRFVEISAAKIGNTAPSVVTSDLQANPGTKTAIFGSEEAADGLPAAQKVADIKVDTVGFAPDPAVLGYIKNGSITAGLGYDIRTTSWVQVDMAARLVTGQPLTDAEQHDPSVMQMLEQKDITFDPTKGFNGYPDVAERFAALWPAAS